VSGRAAVETAAVTIRVILDPALPEGAKRYVLACGHGVTNAALIPPLRSGSRRQLSEAELIELFVVRHGARLRCSCALWSDPSSPRPMD
jgi:hypothetical protein